MWVFVNGQRYNLTAQEIIDIDKKGHFSPNTEVEYKGSIHKLSEFKEIKKYFKNVASPREESKPVEVVAPPITETSEKASTNISTPSSMPTDADVSQAIDIDRFLDYEKAKRKKILITVASCLCGIVLIVGTLAFISAIVDKNKHNPDPPAGHSQASNSGASDQEPNSGTLEQAPNSGTLEQAPNPRTLEQAFNSQDNEPTNNIKELYKGAYTLMLEGGVESEACINLTYRVWRNTIHKERDMETDKYTRTEYGSFWSDFNIALLKLRTDEGFAKRIALIEKNQEEVAGIMKELQKHPEKDQNITDLLLKQYQLYLKVTRLAVEPTGSLMDYGKNSNEAKTEFIDNLRMLELYIE